MLKLSVASKVLVAAFVFSQQAPPSEQPQVKVNVLNVCMPSQEELAVIKNALDKVPGKPTFISDFEITRGRATLKDALASKFVRLRREFPAETQFLTAQYSMSADAASTVELLVFREREAKEFHEIAMEDSVSAAAASPASVVTLDTPVNRIKIERFTKNSVGLTRCPDTDQAKYEPIFKQASEIMARYRAALGLRTAFRSDIAWLGNPAQHAIAGTAQKTTK